ncbi:hypothetical protein D3C72_1027580 [compost metagenome]
MVFKHHARCLRGFAGRVADVEAFDAQRIQRGFIGVQVQRLGQRQRAAGARAGFGQGAGQRHLGVLARLFQPRTARPLRTGQQA